MHRTVIKERVIGTRTQAGTNHAICDQLVREQMPGCKPRWYIVKGLCNGTAFGSNKYRRFKDALRDWN